jgi:hypothetical protein
MTTPTSWNNVPDGKGGWHDVPATPVLQSLAVKAGQAKAYLSDAETKALAQNTAIDPPIRVTTVDGVPTVIARPALTGEAGVGQQVPIEDLDALGMDRDTFPVCEFPACKGEGRHQIFSSAGKPLSINRKGELVFGDLDPMPHAGMSAADKSRAAAGLVGVVGPSGVVGTQMPKCFVNVCQDHQALPHAPKKAAPKRYRSGPWSSYFRASHRAQQIGMRTRTEASVYPVKTDGVDAWYIDGDDGAPGWQGELVPVQ